MILFPVSTYTISFLLIIITNDRSKLDMCNVEVCCLYLQKEVTIQCVYLEKPSTDDRVWVAQSFTLIAFVKGIVSIILSKNGCGFELKLWF